jgi:hypothetical protein
MRTRSISLLWFSLRLAFLAIFAFSFHVRAAERASSFFCNFIGQGEHTCLEYDNFSPSYLSLLHSNCTSTDGTVVTSCPSAKLLGTCTMTQRGVTQKMSYYSDGGITAAMAEMACTSPDSVGFRGTWTTAK